MTNNGEPWIRITEIEYGGDSIKGEVILAQDKHQINTYRSGYALAPCAVQSHFGLGGVANLSAMTPTAGREALTNSSIQFLQTLVTGLERLVAEHLSSLPSADNSTRFMEWARRNNRFDLCGKVTVLSEPGSRNRPLETLIGQGEQESWNIYGGRDQTIINSFATEEQPLIVLAANHPRRDCQEGYLKRFVKAEPVPDRPTVFDKKQQALWTLQESALAFRIASILDSDYFVNCEVTYARISHGLPLVVSAEKMPVSLVLDSQSSTIAPILSLYDTDFASLTGFVKDFIRNAIFPKVAHLVPSSTRDGASAFLTSIRRPRDLFEYELADMGSLTDIWQEYTEGHISMKEAVQQSERIVRGNIQILDSSAQSPLREVLSDVVANQRLYSSMKTDDALSAMPAIVRGDVESDAKLLFVPEGEIPLSDYRGFLAVTDRVRRENTDFFLQPHRTELVWGGQRAMYIFEHHSGTFSLYYDLQGNVLLPSGPNGCRMPSCTIIVKNQIYIPIPDIVLDSFRVNEGERKRFEVRSDLLFPDPL